ncbi:hypothetical protein GCM10027040_15890 [Halomonas shantousis]
MLKGILFCMMFLVAQLLLLGHVDRRVNHSGSEVRYTNSDPLTSQTRQRSDTRHQGADEDAADKDAA